MIIPDLSQNLKSLLFKRYEWYEKELLLSLEQQGDVSLTTAQARALAVLNGESSSISALARSLNISRQAAHKTVVRLIELDWISWKTAIRAMKRSSTSPSMASKCAVR